MHQPDDVIAALGGARNEIIRVLRKHETRDHDGAACFQARAMAVGYVAHFLGMRNRIAFQDVIDVFDRHCPGCDIASGATTESLARQSRPAFRPECGAGSGNPGGDTNSRGPASKPS